MEDLVIRLILFFMFVCCWKVFDVVYWSDCVVLIG